MGEFLLKRGEFCDQVTLCRNNPLSFGEVEFEARAWAGYGVKQDGTVCIRINMLELLSDLLIEIIPDGASWRVVVTDVHLAHKPEVLLDTKEA